MAKRNNKIKRNEEREARDFADGVFDSLREIIPIKTTPSFDITDKFKNVAQRLAYSVYEQHDVLFLLGPAGTGKALPLDAKLYTRNGPIRMGDVKVGDEIADHTGNFSLVAGVYPQGRKQICRVFFSDYTYVDCCEDHLWEVKHCGNGWTKVVDTKFLEHNCRRKVDGKRQLSFACTKPVNFNRKDYIIDPYFMGIILSEGNITNSNLSFSSVEKEIASRVASTIDCEYECKPNVKKSCVDYRVVKTKRSNNTNVYKSELHRLDLWGKHSCDKFIPSIYLYGSVDQRIALLQGMMDGDGTVDDRGCISYSTVSEKLAKDFCQLVYSLGGYARIIIKEGTIKAGGSRNKVSYRCHLNLPSDVEVFFLSRKKRRCKSRKKYLPKRYIDRVERLGDTEMQCIVVANDRNLYLTDNFTVTHNSHLACMFAINDLLRESKSRLVLTRPIVEAGESLGYLPGPQPLDAKILTPKGWIRMGDVKIGDDVVGRDGKSATVIGVFPKGRKSVYKITTTEDTSTECCEDHLWITRTLEDRKRNRPGCVKSTKEILSSLVDKKGRINHFLPRNEKIEFSKKELPLDPYFLGVLLGNGNFGDSRCDRKTKINVVKNKVDDLGLLGKKSYEKFIPEVYKFSSIEDRVALLRGLMDTDGTVKESGECSFTTTSRRLALDVIELVRSLGGRAKMPRGRERTSDSATLNGRKVSYRRVSYEFNISIPDINPFFIKRKSERYKPSQYLHQIGIKSIEEIGEKDVQCILVESVEHLYLTDDFIVTHNTFSEKTDPYMLPLYDCIRKMIPGESSLAKHIQDNTEVAPLAYMRGRSQPLDAKVLTPTGYKNMGDLKSGDKVIGSDGKPTSVLGVYPQGKIDVYRVYFSDGTSVECSDDHLWSTKTLNDKRHGRGYSVKTTKTIRETLKNKHNQKVHRIPMTDPVCFDRKWNSPFDPYAMGAILGFTVDGSFNGKSSITIKNVDQDMIMEFNKCLPKELRIVLSEPRTGESQQYRIVGKKGYSNIIRSYLSENGLLGLREDDKFIPEEFLFGDLSTRYHLLQGLMDTDGGVFKHRSYGSMVQYYSTSKKLADGVRFLVNSLGGTASIQKREFNDTNCRKLNDRVISHCTPFYVVDVVMGNKLNPFRMKKKADLWTSGNPQRLIVKVEYVGKKECQCIRVDSIDNLYLTDHCIVTHNTFDGSVCILDEAQNCTWGQLILFLSRLGENSKMIITGDPAQTDIGRDSALMDVVCRLEGLSGVGMVKFTEEHIVRHKLVSQILKRLQR